MAPRSPVFASSAWTGAFLLGLALLGGCGDRPDPGATAANLGAPPAAEVPAALAELVPGDAVALVYVRSPEALERALRKVVGRFDATAAAEIRFAPMAAHFLAGAEEYWDPTLPAALAIPLPGPGEEPDHALDRVTFIAGMRDAAAAKAKVEAGIKERNSHLPEGVELPPGATPSVRASGRHLAIGPPSPAPPTGRLGGRVPDGDLALRIDLAALGRRYAEEIQEALGGLGARAARPSGEGLKAVTETLGTWVDAALQSADLFEAAATLEGNEVAFAVTFTAKAGSPLDRPAPATGRLAELAGRLPAGQTVYLAASVDGPQMAEWLAPLMDGLAAALPAGEREAWRAYMRRSLDLYRGIGPAQAGAFSLGEGGFRGIHLAEAADSGLYLRRLGEFLTGPESVTVPGFAARGPETSSLAGVEVHSYEMTFDLDAWAGVDDAELPPELRERMREHARESAARTADIMFGGPTLHLHLAALPGLVATSLGDKAALEPLIVAVRDQTPASGPLATVLSKAGPGLVFFLDVDARGLVDFVGRALQAYEVEGVPAVPPGPRIPVTLWGRHEGRVYGGGLRVDLAGVKELVDAVGDR